jgi:hypothetical protein
MLTYRFIVRGDTNSYDLTHGPLSSEEAERQGREVGWVCECPDHQHRADRRNCKHAHWAWGQCYAIPLSRPRVEEGKAPPPAPNRPRVRRVA